MHFDYFKHIHLRLKIVPPRPSLWERIPQGNDSTGSREERCKESAKPEGSRKRAAKNCAWSQGGLVRMGSLSLVLAKCLGDPEWWSRLG